MSTDQQWNEEQQRVNTVTDQIERKITTLEDEVGSFRDEVVGMRKDFWDEVTMNFSEADDVGETSTSMRQQSQVLSDRERSHLNTAAALDKMKRLHHSPYFGRIDFKEDGYPNAERIYLGIASLLDEKEESFLVYDWRAPISNLYYDGAPGPITYHTPSGEISGDIEMKRQFVIRDGRIRFMFDTGVTIGDELLQAVLSRTSDAQMKSIVATIQKEQNRIIRNDRTRMLIVQGAAGSGKTSAALQRVAYLLYKYREHLQADQMVLFHQIQCSTVMSPRYCLSLGRKTCCKRPSRSIWSAVWVVNINWKIRLFSLNMYLRGRKIPITMFACPAFASSRPKRSSR